MQSFKRFQFSYVFNAVLQMFPTEYCLPHSPSVFPTLFCIQCNLSNVSNWILSSTQTLKRSHPNSVFNAVLQTFPSECKRSSSFLPCVSSAALFSQWKIKHLLTLLFYLSLPRSFTIPSPFISVSSLNIQFILLFLLSSPFLVYSLIVICLCFFLYFFFVLWLAVHLLPWLST